ncbi:MAG: class I SAM-dependent DNA methyltransferase [Taibaiella sp.]|nr:class I SAM-dependent DNA methyltransferase [Taibaiella sp.]
MNITQIESSLQQLTKEFNNETFIFDLLLAYGKPKASIKRLQIGGLNLSKEEGVLDWKKELYYKIDIKGDLHELIDELAEDEKVAKHSPRFIVVTDFETLLALDTKTNDSLDIPILDIPKHFDFFLPWAGMEKAQHQNENPADVKAAERMAKLYDEIKKDNPTHSKEEVHNLNVFLSRMLFCFFAEDTGIFKEGKFTNGISSHTQADGSDLNTYLDTLFAILNTDESQRGPAPSYLTSFPYVNGGLFRNRHNAPVFTRKSRQAIIESGELDWSAINPDIFGSMIQAVITPEHRGGLGMHYTSVPNIMKVIEPLFLNELKEEFEAGKNEPRKLKKLLERISKLKIFDPACGSGNFLIIAYKELRLLEIKILEKLQTLQKAATGFEPIQMELIPKAQLTLAASYQQSMFSVVELSQFYGIELDDFAHEIAILSLWLAQHQMNMKFKEVFGSSNPTLPLQAGGNIVHGNATRVDWTTVCPKREGDEIYILGNPPYLGSSLTSEDQKSDMEFVYKDQSDFRKLDYITCWFFKASHFIKSIKATFAFVSTNSVCQGEQVWMLWPMIFKNQQSISFAYNSFNWSNNAKGKAGVTVIILGIANDGTTQKKTLINGSLKQMVNNISPYLVSGNSVFVYPRRNSLSNLPEMVSGSKPTDGGFLILSASDRNKLLDQSPDSSAYIKRYMGADDYINGVERYCLWISDAEKANAQKNSFIEHRIDECFKFRNASKKSATKKKASIPHKFDEVKHQNTSSIIFPITTSYRRKYVPIGFLDSSTVISNSALAIYKSEIYLFSLLSSRMNVIWLSVTGSRMRNDFRYSVNYCYNNLPFPKISEVQIKELEKFAYLILEERERHSERTLAKLYDPEKMPAGLREAHYQNDLAIERCYRSKPFDSDEERLEYLFKLYQQMIAQEKEQGTLFERIEKPRKKKK